MGIRPAAEPDTTDLVVDALIGYRLRGDPEGRTAELIGWTNAQPAPVLSLDTPSGLDVTSGEAATPACAPRARSPWPRPRPG